MKKILIRSGVSPLENFDAAEMIARNSIGGNVGNLIYQFGVYRTLMTENAELVPDYYDIDASEERAEEINENYDAYVIPLADAFRPQFESHLKHYTRLIKQLKIPVYVIGVGLRAPYEPNLEEDFPFDESVKQFVKAVLEKSNIVGVRGEITSKYLSKLGFREGIDHTVIGCPSMYSFGRNLTIKELNYSQDATICFNSSLFSPKNVLKLITKEMKKTEDYYFIPQWLKEMRLTYVGSPAVSKNDKNYPSKITSFPYKENRVRYFLSAPSWINFMKQADLSFGTRLHGNITATIAGTPSIIIPKDGRMRELVEYHNLTQIPYNQIKEDTTLEKLIEKSDFKAPEKVHKQNFDHFISFLNKNEIEHIYQDDMDIKESPLDRELAKLELKPPIEPVINCTKNEILERIDKLSIQEDLHYNERLTELKQKLATKEREVNYLRGTLNRKSLKLTLKIADTISRLRQKNRYELRNDGDKEKN